MPRYFGRTPVGWTSSAGGPRPNRRHVVKSSTNLAISSLPNGTRSALSERRHVHRPSTTDGRVRVRSPIAWKHVAGCCCSSREPAGHSALSAWWGGGRSTSGLPPRRGTIWSASRRSRSVAPQAGTPDQSLWSPNRVSAWRKALSDPAPAPLAVLRIPKIRLEVPVLPGTDDRTLDRAVGHIEDTAQPGTDGNSGIAGHRDGFFRGLKDITPGDVIELDTLQGKESIASSERGWSIRRTSRCWTRRPRAALTLVTCYPFYFVGSAPRRFIVRAVRRGRQSGVLAAIH